MVNFNTSSPKCIGLIIDIAGVRPAGDGRSGLTHIKQGLLDGLSQLEEDDLLYVYRPDGDLAMEQTLGPSIAKISDWQHLKIDVALALEECIVLTSQYTYMQRGVFYITDNYKAKYDGLIYESLREEMRTDGNCSIFAYGIGRAYAKSLSWFGHHINPHYYFRPVIDYSDFSQMFAEDIKKLCSSQPN